MVSVPTSFGEWIHSPWFALGLLVWKGYRPRVRLVLAGGHASAWISPFWRGPAPGAHFQTAWLGRLRITTTSSAGATARIAVIVQTGCGFLSGGRRDASADDREDCYGRATVALTRAIQHTYIVSPLDMSEMVGWPRRWRCTIMDTTPLRLDRYIHTSLLSSHQMQQPS